VKGRLLARLSLGPTGGTLRAGVRRFLACLLLALPAAWVAGDASVDYPAVVPGQPIEFPRDEGSHPDYRTEWWYVTGWVETQDGHPLGFQVTFFRFRPGSGKDNPSRFAARQLLFAHAAVSDPRRGRLVHEEKSARAGFGLAEAAQGRLDVHIDDWMLRQQGEGYQASVQTKSLGIDLVFMPTQPPMLQGEQGYSRKGPADTSASYYYSLPQLRAQGRIVIAGREHRVSGQAWFDHEWSSALMDAPARGWDWVGLNLEDGGALMISRMRDARGRTYWAAGSQRDAGASTPVAYAANQIDWTPVRHWRSGRTGIRYPVEWRVRAGEYRLRLRPLMDDQENDSRGSTGTIYWEGAVRAFDEQGRLVGRGYLELTGYGERIRLQGRAR